MKNLFSALVAIAFGVLSSAAQAQTLTPEEKEWLSGLNIVLAEAQKAGVKVRAVVQSDAKPGDSPAYHAFVHEKRECMFVVAVRGNPVGRMLADTARTSHDRLVTIVAIWAHEYSHCLQNLAGEAKVVYTPKGAPLKSHATREEEALADVYALAWMQSFSPVDFPTALNFFIKLRTVIAPDSGRYAVTEYLEKARELPTLMAKSPATPYQMAQNLVYGKPLPADANLVAQAK